MHKVLPARRKKQPSQSFFARLIRALIVAVVTGAGVLLVGYLLYTAILNNALQLTEPQTIVLVHKSLDSADQKILIVHVASESTDNYAITVSGNQEVTLPAGYGTYRVSAIYPLLTIDKKDSQFITASFSRSLGIIVDDVYGLESLDFQDKKFSQGIFQIVTTSLWQRRTLPLEAIKLWYFARKGVATESADSIAGIQEILGRHRKNNYSFQECPVGVLNASGQAGAAATLSALFEKSGLLSIRTSSYPSEEPVTTIYHDGNEACQKVLEMSANVFVKRPAIVQDAEKTTQYRAPVVILIGKDFQ